MVNIIIVCLVLNWPKIIYIMTNAQFQQHNVSYKQAGAVTNYTKGNFPLDSVILGNIVSVGSEIVGVITRPGVAGAVL